MSGESERIRATERLRKRLGLSPEQIVSLRFAVNVFIASSIVWFTLKAIGDTNPIWAIASMVAASDPAPTEAWRMFRSRLINVLVGCAIGLFFVLLNIRSDWMVPLALALSVLVSIGFVQVKTMWRQTPITAAIVIGSALTTNSTKLGLRDGLHKTGEVLFGCLVGVGVSWFMAHFWVLPTGDEDDEDGSA